MEGTTNVTLFISISLEVEISKTDIYKLEQIKSKLYA